MTRPLKLYNTFTRSLEEFSTLHPGVVKMYTCGPTVYNDQHIGNYRTFIFEDILVKTLRRFGYQVERVMNITDVGHLTSDADEGEDKLELGAKREGKTAWEIAAKYESRFLEDLAVLSLEKPEPLIRATSMVGEQIEMIRQLEEKGYTYQISDGIYFDTSKIEYYGELARLDIAGLQEGIRVANEEKKNKTDFALWKFSPTDKQRDMEWDSPWGKGFPGWHIECSAIIRATLGETIDIHCGGADHISVHHPNEIAQSEAANGKQLSRFWCHAEFLLVDGGKMSKSLGNVYTIPDLESRGYNPLALRLFTYSASYRTKLNFTWDGLTAATKLLKHLQEVTQATDQVQVTQRVEDQIRLFDEALANDLNLPQAMAVVMAVVNSDWNPAEKRAFLLDIDQVLSLHLDQTQEVVIPENVQALLDQRQAAREAKNFELSDTLRDEIANQGFTVQDTSHGQKLEKRL